jgi:hypothetical protein
MDDTKINYRKSENGSKGLTKKRYRDLVSATIPFFLEEKIKTISTKRSKDIKVFFRYKRVKSAFQDLLSNVLINNGFINAQREIGDISRRGGGIDGTKFKQLIKFP